MKLKKAPISKKKLLISAVSVGTAAAILLGITVISRGNRTPVNVFPFQYLGMTEYWGDNQESHGPVSTDNVQTVFLSDTQTVTEIHVEQGDVVKKGELLMSYDSTLTDITLERKRLSVELLKAQKAEASERLQEIRNMVPMVPESKPETTPEVNLGEELLEHYKIFGDREHNGNTTERALICWTKDLTSIDNLMLEELRLKSEELQTPVVTPSPKPTDVPVPSESPVPSETPEPSETPVPSPTPTPAFAVKEYFVVFKVTEGNMSLGTTLLWQGLHVRGDLESGFQFRFFDASEVNDYTLPSDEEELPEEDLSSGYTAAQLAQMRAEQEKRIRDLQVDIRMAEAEYNIMKLELDDGNVYAKIDGTVVSVLTESEAKELQQPLIKVSDGGGYYVDGSISELEKANLTIGQEVTVNDWNTGMEYMGKIISIGDFPITGDGWTGMGNPNASFYPFRVYIDGSADLQAGRYVNVSYSTTGAENGIYLENPFILTESGNYYVYVQGENGRLEKRAVTVGKSLWGSYKQIISGVTADDLIAFPYGKNIREGAPTVESDISALYEY